MTIAELFMRPESESDKLLEEKFEALRKVFSYTEMYEKEGFAAVILDTIMEKKADMILKAATLKDIRELANPPKPHYDGRRWRVSKNSVPEEEMLWWSMASLKAPLNREATERFEDLFRQFYGKDVDEMMKG